MPSFDPAACPPRGRWLLARYVKAYGDTTSLKAYVYEVVAVGDGYPTDPTDPEHLAPGDTILVNNVRAVQAGEGYAYVHFDDGLLAKWNSTYDEPVVLYSTIYAEVDEFFMPQPGYTNFIPVVRVNVLALDSSITDISVGDSLLVPSNRIINVGKRANTRVIFRVEDVLALCLGGILIT